ncbi:MAG: hypothetical protein HQL18_00705 [Candidatus Omnitrophica bacterium]|nr:hypothetical protein [Candidatus Omnitrophota bacterium]
MVVGDLGATGGAEQIHCRFLIVFVTEDAVAREDKVGQAVEDKFEHGQIIIITFYNVKKM